ncbi:MAG: phosphoadenosine phosphosulfate reductase family protein, partial [Chloroflexi bacterium]|nr:phosphoadenosine phosphosulfate reductase family protein [Chloroflexota bacterium]
MVVIDMACRIQPDVRVFTIDTGRLPQETYNLIDEVRKHYDIAVEVYSPNQDELAGFVRQHGINPFYE